MPVSIPAIGLGTWQNTDAETCQDSVAAALDMGYRHVDTAQAYGNEVHVGEGLEKADVDRDDVFLATKVWTTELAHDDVLRSTRKSLERLETDYVDALYVHWPAGEYSAEDTLSAFEELRENGEVRHIGVSNFTPRHLDEAVDVVDVSVHQFEMHPLLQQEELVEASKSRGLEVVAYSPLARGEIFEVPEIRDVAEKHGVSEARVAVAWLLEKGVHPIPKASSRDHVRDNFGALDLELDGEDVRRIDSIEGEERLIDPEFAPKW